MDKREAILLKLFINIFIIVFLTKFQQKTIDDLKTLKIDLSKVFLTIQVEVISWKRNYLVENWSYAYVSTLILKKTVYFNY